VLEAPGGAASVAAECGTLSVPEDPARVDGRRIGLAIARVPAINSSSTAPPLYVLAGGPGAAAREFYAGVAPAFARVHRDRDVILVDQRGTGGSNPLACELDETELMEADADAIAAAADRCRASLTDRADPALYTTSLAVQDLERVRLALGHPAITIYAVSYGTRVAQHYVRRHGRNVAALVLDGVVPPERVLGPDIAIVAEQSLASIFERCRREAACEQAFGDPAIHYRAVRSKLASAPVEVQMPHPRTGEPTTTRFTSAHLASALRLSSYTADQASLLPLALYRAHVQADYRMLLAQYLVATSSVLGQMSYGMHNSVVCAEDVPFFEREPAPLEELDRTYIGRAMVEGVEALCRHWPRGPVDPDLHEPLSADVPTLLLSGGADPVTPVEGATRAAAGFSRAVHVIVPDAGHGQIVSPCITRIVAAFLAKGDPQALDLGCLKTERATPFFTTLAGPSP
jgi:pimeloyl-ACP methyl ester carboxylesterase